MEHLWRLTVGLARADSDRHLLRYARRLADLWPEAAFTFAHVLAWPRPGQDPATVVNHNRAMRELEDSVAQHFGYNSKCRVLSGARVDRLLECVAEDGSDLLLVGHRRTQHGRRSLARRLAMQAPCSLLMAPESAPDDLRSIVAAVDFSEHSAMAVSTAALLAQRRGSPEFLVLHVVQDAAKAPGSGHLERFLAPLNLYGARVRLFQEKAGSVAEAVTRVATRHPIDLVVMGTRGESQSESVLLGNESEQMLMESSRPVLVTKRRGARLGLLQALLDREFEKPAVRRAHEG